MDNERTVVAVFDSRDQAECAVQGLKRSGLGDNDIGMAMPAEGKSDVEHRDLTQGQDKGSKAGEGAATGAVTGGLLGGILGAAASLIIPGVGPIIALGTLGSALAGAAAGAVGGGLLGALVGEGIPEEEARYYDEQFRTGRIIVTARADGNYTEAYNILRQCGGYDMEQGQAMRQEGMHPGTTAYSQTGEQTIPLHEEELRVSKDKVQTGEVEVRKDVVTEKKTIEVPTTREEVVVERHPASGKATGEEFREGATRIPTSEEQVHVEKEPVKKEEVRISKEQVQDTKEVEGDVRKEDIRVERKRDMSSQHDEDYDRNRP
jgi:uncharacterized protein (TIGR02271 family)